MKFLQKNKIVLITLTGIILASAGTWFFWQAQQATGYKATQTHRLEDFAATEKILQQLQSDDPDNPFTSFNLGVLNYKQDKFADAQQQFMQTTGQTDLAKPGHKKLRIAAYANHGHSASKQGSQTIQADQSSVEACDKAIEHFQDALASYHEGLTLSPDDERLKKAIEVVSNIIKSLEEHKHQLENPPPEDEQQDNQQQDQQPQGSGGDSKDNSQSSSQQKQQPSDGQDEQDDQQSSAGDTSQDEPQDSDGSDSNEQNKSPDNSGQDAGNTGGKDAQPNGSDAGSQPDKPESGKDSSDGKDDQTSSDAQDGKEEQENNGEEEGSAPNQQGPEGSNETDAEAKENSPQDLQSLLDQLEQQFGDLAGKEQTETAPEDENKELFGKGDEPNDTLSQNDSTPEGMQVHYDDTDETSGKSSHGTASGNKQTLASTQDTLKQQAITAILDQLDNREAQLTRQRIARQSHGGRPSRQHGQQSW